MSSKVDSKSAVLRIAACVLGLLSAMAMAAEERREVHGAEESRLKAQETYRRAIAALRVQSYLHARIAAPGDEADLLLTEFQESLSAREITSATEFLKDYPDDEIAKALLLFQIRSTSGIWAPWKRLALALLDRCSNVVEQIVPCLPAAEQSKFLADAERGLAMANDPAGGFIYPLADQRRDELLLLLRRLKQTKPNKASR